jgi:PAT family beta-lactamase induction signal transducer AmpG
MENPEPHAPSPWRWIPTLYFCEGVPNAVAANLSVVFFKNLGISNAEIAFYTSALYLPWVLKPLWSPAVEFHGTKRLWTVALQLILACAFAGLFAAVSAPHFLGWMLILLWVLAFSSATHDIAADGFCLLALPVHQQAAYVGVRNTCYRISTIAVKGALVGLAGKVFSITGNVHHAWAVVFIVLASWFVASSAYHFFVLPQPAGDRPLVASAELRAGFAETFHSFLEKPRIGSIVAFLLFYRLAEAMALKLVEPFLLDARSVGGLGLSNQQLAFVNGTGGVIALLVGGLLGGWLISRHGLRKMLWPMVLSMHLPIVVFFLLALMQPQNIGTIAAALAAEQFGYGFGFTAYMVYMMLVAGGRHKTAHYAICTGFMAAGLMVPGMIAGELQERLGYADFFLWTCVATIPSFIATALIKVDPAFGKKA